MTTMKTFAQAGFLLLTLAATEGCSSLSAPFDKLKDEPMTIYRLQNYEPQTAAPTPAAGATPAAVPGLPPQLAQWAQQAAQLLPPGLIPPGLIPGAPATPAAAVPENVPRFHDFRILAYQQISDSGQRGDIVDVFGHESNFQDKYENCFFPEFGFAIAQPSGQPADILVSLSCQQVKAFNFNWPYSKIGLPPDTQKKIAAIVSKAFGS
jgi:hypothetical protein